MTTKAHAAAARRNGKEFGGAKQRTPEQLAIAFWNNVLKAGPTPTHAPHLGCCWIWKVSKDVNGYGNFSVRGRPSKAHRYSYEIHNGSFDPRLWVLHKCDNPSCVRPSHLFLGTAIDNNRDAIAKGRASLIDPPTPNISPSQVEYVKHSFNPGKRTAKDLARELGVSVHSVKWAIYGSYKKATRAQRLR